MVVGPKLVSFGFKIVAATFHDAACHAVLQELAEVLGEQVELGVVRNNNVVYLDSVRSTRPGGLQIEPGRRAPLHCTSTGKLHLGHLPPIPQERLIYSLPLTRHTPRTITEPLQLISEVRNAKANGYATSNEELVVGVVGCALPILDQKGDMVAGLGVTVPLARLQGDSILKILPSMRRAAERLRATFAVQGKAEPAEMQAAESLCEGS